MLSRKKANGGEIIPAIMLIKNYLHTLVFDYEEEFFMDLKDSLINSANVRLEIYLSNKFLIKTAFLNFKYKDADILDCFFSQIETELNVLEEENKLNSNNIPVFKTKQFKNDKNYIINLEHNFLSSNTNKTSSIKDEIDIYKKLEIPIDLKNEENFMIWKEYSSSLPNLGRIARKYLSIPAGSIINETLFSQVSNIDTIKRNRLLPENMQNIIFVKKNLAFVEKKYDHEIYKDY